MSIDAFICLANMMNIPQLALNQSIFQWLYEGLFNNVFILYFAQIQHIELDECMISFLYSLSQHQLYTPLIKERISVIMYLIDRQIKDRNDEKDLHQCLNCLKRILSVLTTLTDINELEVCKGLDSNVITELVNRIIKYLMKNK